MLIGISCVLSFIFLCWFFAVAIGSSAGEAASALGGVIGGAIGAGGAGYSVYWTLTQQRKDEIEKTSYAVLTEIAVMTKYIVANLGFCEMVKTAGLQFPRKQLDTVLRMPESVIYKSVADKISFFPRPTQVVEFYTRIGEMTGITALITNTPNENEFIQPYEMEALADLFITQCQVVEAILGNTVHDSHSEAVLSEGLRSHVLGVLRQQLEQAKVMFPNADAFH
jgi:hypothetical protein